MHKAFSVISVALLLICGSATAGIPPTEAQKVTETVSLREPVASGCIGVLAVTAGGDTLACLNPRKKLVPASNMKVFTTGLALRLLGEDYRFKTSLAYSGYIQDGVLEGDLYIVGGGDPTTGSDTDCATPLNLLLAQWRRIVQEAGIRRIHGCVIGDPRFFGFADQRGRNWGLEDMGTFFGIGPSGLNFFENKQNLSIAPGATVGAKPFVSPRKPEAPWMRIRVTATTSGEKSANTLYYIPSEFGPFGEVRGHFPVDRKAHTLECSNIYGAYTCAYYFYKSLVSNGIPADGYGDVSPLGLIRTDLTASDSGVKAPSASELTVIGSTESAPLSEIVEETNKESDNFYAETLFRMIGLSVRKSATDENCIASAESSLASMGLKVKGNCQYDDGCGLSRANYCSPAFFVAFLKTMMRSRGYDAFFDSLPVTGIDGTMKYRLSGSPDDLRHRVHAKTGSMNGVRCVCGYITPSDGVPEHTIVFSVMTNNVIGKSWAVNNQIDDILEALAKEN